MQVICRTDLEIEPVAGTEPYWSAVAHKPVVESLPVWRASFDPNL